MPTANRGAKSIWITFLSFSLSLVSVSVFTLTPYVAFHRRLRYGQTKKKRAVCVCACAGWRAVGECRSQQHASRTPEEDKWLREIVCKKKFRFLKIASPPRRTDDDVRSTASLPVAALAILLSCCCCYFYFFTTNPTTYTSITTIITTVTTTTDINIVIPTFTLYFYS